MRDGDLHFVARSVYLPASLSSIYEFFETIGYLFSMWLYYNRAAVAKVPILSSVARVCGIIFSGCAQR